MSENRVNQSKWNIQGSRVHGNGKSYNVNNKITALELCNTLNTYENTLKLHKNIETQYDSITKQLIQIKLSIGTLQEEVQSLEEQIHDLNSH